MSRAPGLPTALLLSALTACGDSDVPDGGFTAAPTSTVPPATDESSTGLPTTSDDTSTSTTTTTGDTTTTTGDDATTTSEGTTGDPVDLCAHLGGMDPAVGIPPLVDAFLARVLTDDRVNGYFLNSDVDNAALATCLGAQLGALAGCPGVAYTCQDMKAAHQGLGVSDLDLADFVELLAGTLAAGQAERPELTAEDIDTVTAALLALAPDIVEDPTHDATLYQRIGRKPRLREIVGTKDKSSTFLGILDDDNAINGFFLSSDFTRFGTCFLRQLAAIDGPVVYGAEVTAPDGVEPGVAADDPCRDMSLSHAGLLDDLLTPITIDDFMVFLADLAKALDKFNAPVAERDQLLAALTELCPQIVVDTNECPGNNTTVTVEAADLGIDLAPFNYKYDGTLGSMACVPLAVADDGINYITDVRLKVALDHTWVGDVTIKLASPDNAVLTVLSRVGDPGGALPDSSEGCCGDDSNLSKDAPLIFTDSALFPGADIGKGPQMKTSSIICKDEVPKHVPCEWTVYPGNGPGAAFADFSGTLAPGDWQVCFGDSGMSDLGSVSAVALTFDKVKEPF